MGERYGPCKSCLGRGFCGSEENECGGCEGTGFGGSILDLLEPLHLPKRKAIDQEVLKLRQAYAIDSAANLIQRHFMKTKKAMTSK